VSQNPTFYRLLNVSPAASDAEIKASFRKLARQYHPDVNAGSAEAERHFKAVGEAYATLSNPEKRKQYDALNGVTPKPKQTQASTSSSNTQKSAPKAEPPKAKPNEPKAKSAAPPPPKKQTPPPKESPKEDPTAKASNQFKGMFDGLFRKEDRQSEAAAPKPSAKSTQAEPPKSQTKPKAPPASRGEDVIVETVITGDEAERGTVKPVSVFHVEPCKRCSASGKVNGLICPACGGEKQQTHAKKLDVRIPAGVKTGSKVRVAKEGGYGVNGGEPGDLFLLVKVDNDKSLRIEGPHVYSEVPVTLPEAVLGCDVQVKTLQGVVTMQIPPLTASGTVLRLKGKGVVVNSNTPIGDQFVTVQVVMPKSLTSEEKTHYQALLKLQTARPR